MLKLSFRQKYWIMRILIVKTILFSYFSLYRMDSGNKYIQKNQPVCSISSAIDPFSDFINQHLSSEIFMPECSQKIDLTGW